MSETASPNQPEELVGLLEECYVHVGYWFLSI